MTPTIRQKAIRKAILNYAENRGSVNRDFLIPAGFRPDEVEVVLQELYYVHDLERITKGDRAEYFIPEQPRR